MMVIGCGWHSVEQQNCASGSGSIRRYPVVSGGIRRYPVVSDGIRWYPVVSGGIRRYLVHLTQSVDFHCV
jgi:hypothetical protein